jgi:hypothetical protein
MWNKPTKEQLAKIPKLYETENVSLEDKIIHFHLFIGGCDWFVCESDGSELLWGYAILNADFESAEWGYISLSELADINIGGIEIDNDLYWKKRPAKEINKIRRGMRW